MNFYPHHISDFNNATRHLTRVERSVYRDLIELYYDTESLLTDDLEKLARRVLCNLEEEKQALKDVLSEFFIKVDNGFLHERCDYEIAKYRANTSAKAKAGIASALARQQKSTGVKQPLNSVELTNNQEPLTNNLNTLVPSKAGDECPHEKIIELYHSNLPMLTQVKIWSDKRKTALKTRWREDPKRQSLEYWDRLFKYISRSDFLTGKASDWQADLEWIVNATNFVKIIEGKYDNKVQA